MIWICVLDTACLARRIRSHKTKQNQFLPVRYKLKRLFYPIFCLSKSSLIEQYIIFAVLLLPVALNYLNSPLKCWLKKCFNWRCLIFYKKLPGITYGKNTFNFTLCKKHNTLNSSVQRPSLTPSPPPKSSIV